MTNFIVPTSASVDYKGTITVTTECGLKLCRSWKFVGNHRLALTIEAEFIGKECEYTTFRPAKWGKTTWFNLLTRSYRSLIAEAAEQRAPFLAEAT